MNSPIVIRLEYRLLSELRQLVCECSCFFPSFPSNYCILRESAHTLCALRKSACKVYLFSLITLLCQTISVNHCFASISLHLIILSKSLITASNSRNFKIKLLMCTVFGLTFLPFSRLISIKYAVLRHLVYLLVRVSIMTSHLSSFKSQSQL